MLGLSFWMQYKTVMERHIINPLKTWQISNENFIHELINRKLNSEIA
jgi:hypothetical protein